ncbi:hypothetical protein J2N86_08395 [Legionella lytica]|uniref:Transposase n=1 Tax=Legionella lytica TaxID=96232 RepID=A0ABY4Y5V3_9GAMM|nr:hypothetical protein [Legionella lytica]USQ12728.1 hypothetical protein J2N86_08395 [Legionella lytica]
MKVQKKKLSPYDYSWIVLDNNHLPSKPITEFIRYLNSYHWVIPHINPNWQ